MLCNHYSCSELLTFDPSLHPTSLLQSSDPSSSKLFWWKTSFCLCLLLWTLVLAATLGDFSMMCFMLEGNKLFRVANWVVYIDVTIFFSPNPSLTYKVGLWRRRKAVFSSSIFLTKSFKNFEFLRRRKNSSARKSWTKLTLDNCINFF